MPSDRAKFPEITLVITNVMIGKIGGIPFYISETQHEAWKNTDLIIDCVEGMGGMFSLDNGTGRRFLTRSEICIPEKNIIIVLLIVICLVGL